MVLDFKLSLDDEHSSWWVALPSKTAHNLPFFVEFIGDYYTHIDFYTKRDNVTNFMLMYTVCGKSTLEYENAAYTLDEGSVFLVDCMKYHYFRPLTPNWHYKWMHISGESISVFYNMLYPHKPQVLHPDSPESIDGAFVQLTELIQMPSVKNDLKINAILTSLFTDIISQENAFESMTANRYLKQCIDYIANHYPEPLTIEQLASSVFISKHYLINLFNKSVGMPPYRYLTNYRLSQSKFLLLNTDLMVGEIAIKVGFNSESQYIKLFNQYVGITPKQFRKRNLMLRSSVSEELGQSP